MYQLLRKLLGWPTITCPSSRKARAIQEEILRETIFWQESGNRVLVCWLLRGDAVWLLVDIRNDPDAESKPRRALPSGNRPSRRLGRFYDVSGRNAFQTDTHPLVEWFGQFP